MDVLLKIIGIIILVLGLLFLGVWLVMLSWNGIAGIFKSEFIITYKQAWYVMIGCVILGSIFRGATYTHK